MSVKNAMIEKKIIFAILLHVVVKMDDGMDASIVDNSVIKFDAIIDAEETILKNIIYKTQNFYILLTFLLITIILLIAISIYCYLIKCGAEKSIYLLPFHNTSSK